MGDLPFNFQFNDFRKGSVLAKLKTDSEFRSAITFEKEGMIHIIPGKVSNIFDAEREVLELINNKNIIENGAYRYSQDGVLSKSLAEILKKTCYRAEEYMFFTNFQNNSFFKYDRETYVMVTSSCT